MTPSPVSRLSRVSRKSRVAALFGSSRSAREGAIVLTLVHVFIGAVTVGLGIMRGTESNLSFQFETTLGHANFGASKLGTDHVRAANSIATNNTMSASVMGPRLSVESANIVMDAVGQQIACPACNPYNSYMCQICQQYNQNKFRGVAKKMWSQAKQSLLWTALSSLSGQMDKMASAKATELIASKVAAVDPKVSMSTEDPSTSSNIWGGDSSKTACNLASQDAQKSPVQDSPFPLLVQNLLPGMPTALIPMIGSLICGASSSGSSTGSGTSPNLSALPAVAKQNTADCDALETQIQQALSSRSAAYAANAANGGGYNGSNSFGQNGDATVTGKLSLTTDQTKYLDCTPGASKSGTSGTSGTSGVAYRAPVASSSATMFRYHGQICSFDSNKCLADMNTQNSTAYLNALNQLPSAVTSASGAAMGGMSSILGSGQSTRAPADSNWNSSKSMQACSHASRPVDDGVVSLTSAIKTVSSFWTAPPSNVLTQNYDYASCAKWYFPDGNTSQCAGVDHDEQPLTACWTGGQTWRGNQ